MLDSIHVIEYLWVAGRVFHPEPDLKLERWVQKCLLEILRSKADPVAGEMRCTTTFLKLKSLNKIVKEENK